MIALGLAVTATFGMATQSDAAEWQWSVPMGEGRAFLWIPPDCREVRAVMIGQSNMLEEGVLEHAAMRRTLASLGIAEVFIAPVFDPVFRFDRGAGGQVEGMLRALAAESGYAELATAPVVPIGHSACASYPWNFAAWNSGRTLAVLSLKGDAPQTHLTGSGKPNPDWGDRRIDGVPGLMAMGEDEWWEARLEPLVKFQAEHPAVPLGLLADVGRGHFEASDEFVEFLALFVRKAAAARLPSHPGEALLPVDPAQGWLVDRWRGAEPLRAAAAPAAAYQGDRAEAFWCFDEEAARATEAYYARMRGKRPQQVDFVQEGSFVPIGSSHAGVELAFVPLEDGITFRLGAGQIVPLPPKPRIAAKDAPPPPSRVIPKAAAAGAHAPGPVRIARITGPVVQLDAETFRVAWNRASVRGGQFGGDIWLYAWHPGNATYRSAVQQAVLKLPRHTTGAAQRITFAPIADQSLAARTVKLGATSDAGAPVSYFVREGPAEIEGGTLRFTAIPPRAKLPVKITVVAWQLGRAGVAPLQAAPAVERTFSLRP